jgi:DNA adenine methylase
MRTPSDQAAHPFLKWVGSKRFLASEILPRLPKKIKTYYEPFVGGGAVFFALAAEGRFERAVIGDANEELMNVYAMISMYPTHLTRFLSDFAQDEKTYYKIRAQDPATLSLRDRAARTIYLNKVGFNGLYRVNRKGGFNVPWGRQEGRTLFDEENIVACSTALRDLTTLASLDFENTVFPARRGDAIYYDPPYLPVSTTANFTSYTAGGFTLNDQERLRDNAMALVKRGVHVLLSNSDTPLVRKLYKGFKIEEVQAPRRVNSKGSKRGNVGELLISGRSAK